ncbi:hypothetical protein WP3W18E06_16200 [Raoultella ornithinolytica]|jgi:hypothetical protein|nr:hypothetical protein AB00_3276 [Raoultella ornithinolytica 2-156-04_S1_C1]KDX13354.1 hypothetical protein AB28_3281 [Raoultella ornithinolytica 2-156-04_S1_C2]CAE6328387.1 hypothetical protein AI2711V1_1499 [Raoultella ornithinolytica]CAH3419407.1 hypothetical protein AI2711V1_1499 [Raoultella ornithinolytica]VTN04161.1 Uncharacterised protein [Raoultella ornithinolytica]
MATAVCPWINLWPALHHDGLTLHRRRCFHNADGELFLQMFFNALAPLSHKQARREMAYTL